MTGPLMKGPEPHHSPVDPRRPVSFSAVAPDFTGYSHQELEAMVEHADPARVSTVAEKLKGAAKDIKDVGEDLKKYIAHVPWEGEGGDAFRNWGADMANATLKLGDCSEAAGKWMHEAASMLDHAQRAMPKYSTSAKSTLDAYLSHHPQPLGAVPTPLQGDGDAGMHGGTGPTQAQAFAAQKQLQDDHMQAAQQIGNLAQAYGHSEHQISATERPRFPAIPGGFMPKQQSHQELRQIPLSDDPASQMGSGGTAATGSNAVDPTSMGRGMAPGNPQRVGLDGGVEVPADPTTPSAGIAAPPTDHSPRLPGVVRPPGIETVPRGPGAATEQRLPNGGRPGTSPNRGAIPGRPSGDMPRAVNDGIFGGRAMPRTPGTPAGNVPRGVVIGTEPGPEAAQRRPPAGPGAGYVGGPGSAGGRFGAVGGQPSAPERRGVIGGHPGASSDRPFTPGGSGLSRGRQAEAETVQGQGSSRGGMVPTGGVQGASSSRRNAGQRPDYLVEDEETWSQGRRRAVPPVID